VCANLFFAIINREMSVQGKKRDRFDLGATAYGQAGPGIYAAPTYVCPICRKPFTVEALDDGRLSKEHVPRFRLIDSLTEVHHTPFGTTQQFMYCFCVIE
jgi:hypothetical protein